MIHILGIRHHGVGSARMVAERLRSLKPDFVLVEGPPEIDELLSYITHPDLKPPVALMLYDEKHASRSSFYPFSTFSPEWVACEYALKNNIPVKAIDLPAAISLTTVFRKGDKPTVKKEHIKDNEEVENKEENDKSGSDPKAIVTEAQHRDPLSYLAAVNGFENSEAWWESQFEMSNSSDSEAYFEAVLLAMGSLRKEEIPSSLDVENTYREAYMRQIIRQVESDLYTNIAVICGAWHGPALVDIHQQDKKDVKLLKSLPKSRRKITASWIPWTSDRLSLHSGYGAGIQSPGWYKHLWNHYDDAPITWLSKVATLFREKGHDISSAHVLEAYRLAIALCQLRGKSSVHLAELNESVLTVMCMGDGILLELIKKELIVGSEIGIVPEDIPKVPLQQDFEKNSKSLRLKLSAEPKEIFLDLRKEFDLRKSAFLHQLHILEISWAKPTTVRNKGTFKEGWSLTWSPELMLNVVEKAYLGNTVEAASAKFIEEKCLTEQKFAKLVHLLTKVIAAGLDNSVQSILARIDELSTISRDIQDIMTALPSLIQIKRYGDVRKSDFSVLDHIVNRLSTKVYIHLPLTCYGLDEESGNKVFKQISNLHIALKINEEADTMHRWFDALQKVLSKDGVQKVIQGCVTRLLLDSDQIDEEEAFKLIRLALSLANDPKEVASWVEGFLRGSGMILIYDNRLWNLLYEWVAGLQETQFMELLPFIRRAFSKFEYGERKQIGQKAKAGLSQESASVMDEVEFDNVAAATILPTLKYLMGHE